MSEQPPGPGWWIASDGNWYPPELHPAAPQGTPAASTPRAPGSAPTGRRPLVALVAILVVLTLVAGTVLVARSRGGADDVRAVPASGPDELPAGNLTLGDRTVVVRGGGGAALRSIADDGRTLTLDAAAEGADKLTSGKVMLLTGITAVKVEDVQRNGDTIVVTAAPAAITDVVKDGTISWNDVEAKGGTAHVYLPAEGDFIDQGAPPAGTAPSTSHRMASGPSLSIPLSTRAGRFASGPSISQNLGGYDVTLAYEPGDDGNTVKVSAKRSAGSDAFSMEMTGEVKVKPFTTSGQIRVSNSTVESLRYLLSNLSGSVTLRVKAGLDKGDPGIILNKLKQLKIPAKIETPVVIDGIPFILSYSAVLQLEPIFPSKNATIEATATVTFSGNAGVNFTGVTATPESNIVPASGNPLDTVKGISLAAVAFTYTLKVKVGIGLGVERVNTGVYAEVGAAAAANVAGSTMAAPCIQESIRFWVDMGADATFMGWTTEVARVKAADKTWKYYVPNTNICKI